MYNRNIDRCHYATADGEEVRFTTLPWIERQLVKEWRTYDWEEVITREVEDDEEVEGRRCRTRPHRKLVLDGAELDLEDNNEDDINDDKIYNDEDDEDDDKLFDVACTMAPRPLPVHILRMPPRATHVARPLD
jgi:hypothetical protein